MSLKVRIKKLEAKLKSDGSERMFVVFGFGEYGRNIWLVDEQRYESEKGVKFDFYDNGQDARYLKELGEDEPQDLFELREICNKYGFEIGVLPCVGCKDTDLWADYEAG